MVRLPDDFRDEFEEKGETFFRIAELLYTQPNRRYTQSELAEKMACSNTVISRHTGQMFEENWLDRQDGQTTFAWNSKAHNPASTEGTAAIKSFYLDLWNLLRKHLKTGPGTFAIFGFALILAAIVVFAFFVGFSLNFTQKSAVPLTIYLVIAIGSFLSGVIVTFLSLLQAHLNRIALRLIPEEFTQR